MAVDTITPRSRRALLAAAAGGLAALVAQALGRPAPARAGTDGDVVLGATNTATTTTKIANTADSSIVFWGSSSSGVGVYGTSSSSAGVRGYSSSSGYGVSGTSGSSAGVYGTSGSGSGVSGLSSSSHGVKGESVEGTGVYALSTSGTGVDGASTSGVGVFGTSWSNVAVEALGYASAKPAILARHYGGQTGVYGYSGAPADPPAAPSKTGVYGYAVQDSGSRGVWGRANAGRGVYGQATSGRGVHGFASSGTGGYFGSGPSGKALHAEGRVSFSTAGLSTIAAGAYSVPVTPGVDLTADSKVLATLQANGGGSCAVERVEIDAAADSFRVYVTVPPVSSIKVAWFVIG